MMLATTAGTRRTTTKRTQIRTAKAMPATTTSTATVSAAAGGRGQGRAGTEGRGLPEGGARLVKKAAVGELALDSRDHGLCSGGRKNAS